MSEHVQMADQSAIPPLPGSPATPPPSQQFGQGGQRPPNGVPRFEMVPTLLPDGSYINVEFVDILTPGDPKSVPRHKVTPELREIYKPWYDHWRKGLTMSPTGVPLEMWPLLTPAQVATLKAQNIFTVEQLVAVADSQLHNIPMGRTLRNQAKTWMDEKGKSDSIEEYRRATETMQQGIRMLEAQVAELRSEKLSGAAPVADPGPAEVSPNDPNVVLAPAKRGPGRPRLVPTDTA